MKRAARAHLALLSGLALFTSLSSDVRAQQLDLTRGGPVEITARALPRATICCSF